MFISSNLLHNATTTCATFAIGCISGCYADRLYYRLLQVSAYHRALVKCTYIGIGEGTSPVLGDGGILICPRGTGVQAEEHTAVVKIAV